MPAQKRFPTDYPGVYFIEGKAVSTGKPERIYVIRYRRDGKLVEEKAGRQFQDDMTPAKANRVRAERIEGKVLPNKMRRVAEQQAQLADANKMTIGRLWEEFSRQKGHIKSASDDCSRWRLYLAADFAEKDIDDVVTLDVDRVRHRLLKRKLAPATVKHALVLLKRIIRFAVRKGMCKAPDESRLHFEMPVVRNETTEDLTPDELANLWRAMEEEPNIQAANMMRMALFTGMRRGEMFRLKWGDVDFDRGFILLRDTKGGGDQKIPLNDAARNLLRTHPRTDSEYVLG